MLKFLKKYLKEYRLRKSWNRMENRVKIRLANLNDAPGEDLSKSQIQQVVEFYRSYAKVSSNFHAFYTKVTGRFNVKYMPDNFHYRYIDSYYNDWDKAKIIDNKTFYHILFSDLPQPSLLLYRQGGFWYNKNREIIPLDNAINVLKSSNKFFIKKAVDSYGGHGVVYIESGCNEKVKFTSIINSWHTDIVVQEGIVQSPITWDINPTSVNTIRIMTLLRKDGSIKIVSSILRMGIGGAKVDNASSGGITVGIKEDGSLKEVAYAVTGKKYSQHPDTGVVFNSIILPNYHKAVEMVARKALQLPYFRLISWDIALDINNEPILIEANLKDGELDFHQLNNGPLYGDETESILKEVFGHNESTIR